MGLLDKIKNALFEEEYVEVEEKPKKIKKVKERETTFDDEKPIAKKVILQEKVENRDFDLDDNDLIDEDFDINPSNQEVEVEPQKDFKIMSDEDFQVDKNIMVDVEPSIIDNGSNEQNEFYDSKYKIEETKKTPYGGSGDFSNINAFESSIYEPYSKKDDRTHFKPSPIISPIYGILDKNYRKEDVISKKEVRITSSYCKDNLSVDDVRRKAYGNLEEEEEPISKKKEPAFEIEELTAEEPVEEENLLVDLTDESEKPAVKEVTVGDALEYFEDLGLEYNVDYMDATKKRRSDRYVNENKNEEDNSFLDTKSASPVVEEISGDAEIEDEGDDDNLFDLIDSMYKDED